jgi:hypothetical protein
MKSLRGAYGSARSSSTFESWTSERQSILHFMRDCDFRSQSFVERSTALNYAFVIAHTDRVAHAL